MPTNLPQPGPANDTGGGSGGGGHAVSIGKLETSLNWAWRAIIGLATVFGLALVFFLLRIDDRFDRVDTPLKNVSTNVAVQAKSIEGIERSLERIENRLDAPASQQGDDSERR